MENLASEELHSQGEDAEEVMGTATKEIQVGAVETGLAEAAEGEGVASREAGIGGHPKSVERTLSGRLVVRENETCKKTRRADAGQVMSREIGVSPNLIQQTHPSV